VNNGSVDSGKLKLRDIVEKDYSGSLELAAELEEYYAVCCEIFLFMARFAVPNYLRLIQLRKQIFQMRPNNMDDAEPVLWHGPMPDASGSAMANQSYFSFGEVEILGEQLAHCVQQAPDFLNVVPRSEDPK